MTRLVLIFVLAVCCGAAQPAEDVVLRALLDEMKRAASELRLEDLPRPYYVDYLVLESDTYSGAAVFGGLARSRRYQSRSQRANVRVGDYRLDNTNYTGAGRPRSYDVYSLPLENDYGVLRRHFWLSADESYKAAVEALARKRAALRNIKLPVQLNDFARQEPIEHLEPPARLRVDQRGWEARLRELSAVFRRFPRIVQSRVELEASAGTRYFVSSEGTRVRDPEVLYLLQAFATAQAADGMRLNDSVWIAVRREELLGEAAKIRTEIEGMAARLTAMAEAGTVESYSGPVLFEKTAAAQLFAEILGRNLALTRQPVSEGRGGMFGGMRAGGLGGALDGRRKSRILPDWMEVADDPTQAEWQGRPLLGHYEVDLEGVRAQRVDLIRRGVLENYLLSRLPVRSFEGSNGHGRLPGPAGTALAMPGNLFVQARQTVPEADLKKQLIEICRAQDREFGLLIRKLDFPSSAPLEDLRNTLSGQGQGSRPTSTPIAVYKVYVSDGREEPVRGLRLHGFSVRNLRDIIAAGDEPFVFHYIDTGAPFPRMEGSYGAETSVIAPSVLIDDVELRGGEEERPNLPIVPHPYFASGPR
jgi:TldD protein